MKVTEALTAIESDKTFIDWKEKHKNSYFSSAFTVVKGAEQARWELGYYNPDNNKVITFIIEDNKVTMGQEEEVFQKEKKAVMAVQLEDAKVPFQKAIALADEFLEKTYPSESALEKIIVLQSLEEFGLVWNMTYVTRAFNTLNMKISASDGKILFHELSSLMDMGRFN